MALKLPESIVSPDQLMFCAEELHQYAVTMAKLRHRVPTGEPEALSAESKGLLQLLPKVKQTSDEAIEELRVKLERVAQESPAITIILAAPPSTGLKQELAGWLRKNVHPSVLMSVHVNPDIAGGMVIRTASRVYDCSFRSQLLAHPESFTKVLERV